MSAINIKLVIDARMLCMSGIGTYLQNILPFLINNKGFEVSCLVLSKDINHPSLLGSSLIICDIPIFSIKELILLQTYIPRTDIYWAANWNMPIASINAKKVLLTIHDVNQLDNPKYFAGIIPKLAKILIGLAIRKSDKIITVSAFSKKQIVKHFRVGQDKISWSHLAVKEDFSNVSNNGFTPSMPYILYAGNIKPHKNLIGALEAIKLANISNCRFLIIGKIDGFKSGYGSGLNELIMELGDRVAIVGHVSDLELKQYYANASLFFFPSFYEGFGLPILEAMKYGLPILTTKEAAIPEVGGAKVFYTNPFDAKVMAKDLIQLFDSGIFGKSIDYSDWLSNFSWKKTAEAHIEAIKSLM
ncbi:MAG: glycosyltransferase family 4 protein [Bacteroidetes bacterium]|nr:glycosyltransferase family 4 protein [Bacteroidota bacterium]